MTCTYKVSTLDKKSICQEEIFQKIVGNEVFEVRMEQWWRWGYVVLSEVAKDEIDADNPNGLLVTDYSIEDQDLNDGVALWFTYSENMTEEDKQQFESAWEEDGYGGIEELGFNPWDVEMTFVGPLEVELLEEQDEQPSDEQPTKGAWPFS